LGKQNNPDSNRVQDTGKQGNHGKQEEDHDHETGRRSWSLNRNRLKHSELQYNTKQDCAMSEHE